MDIAMDLTQVPREKTGIGIFAVNLVREILRLNHPPGKFHFYFFIQDDDEEWRNLIPNTAAYSVIPIRSTIFRKLICRFFFEQVLLPRKCKRLEVQVIFSLHYTIPYLTRISRVVIIPDLTFYLFPGLHQKIKRLYFKTFIPLSLRMSSKIVTISDSSRNDLLKRFRWLNPGKVETVHLGAEVKIPPAQAKDHLEHYGLKEKKYFLFVGTLEPRKNLSGIIEAFYLAVTTPGDFNKDYKLVIVGKKGWFYQEIFETVEKHHLEEKVIFTGYVDEEVKQSLLAHAFLFVYPSFYEGFGLPVLEAMAYGVPVITGNVSSLPEVSGDAALLIDPYNGAEIAKAMVNLLSHQGLRDDLSRKSLAQAQEFSWQHTAEKILALFNSLQPRSLRSQE